MLLRNKTILITGASGDIGRACASLFLKEGAHLILHAYRHPEKIEKLRSRYPNRIETIRCDGTSEEEVADAYRFLITRKKLRRIDVLVNNAGDLLARVPARRLTWDFVSRTLDVNLKSAFLFTQHALPLMRKNGSIIFVSSLTARSGKGDRSSAYGMAKGALLSWSRCLANELGKDGIRVNALTPGFIEGSFHARYTAASVARAHARKNPMGRIGTPDDVARAALFYASDLSGYVSGTTLDVCGADFMA